MSWRLVLAKDGVLERRHQCSFSYSSGYKEKSPFGDFSLSGFVCLGQVSKYFDFAALIKY